MDEIFRESMWSRYLKLKHEAFGKKCEKLGRVDHGVPRAWEFPPAFSGIWDFLPWLGTVNSKKTSSLQEVDDG